MTNETNDRPTELADAPRPIRVAVTGTIGYIGSRIVAQLQDKRPEWKITAFGDPYRGSNRKTGSVTVGYVDMRNRDRSWNALEVAETVRESGLREGGIETSIELVENPRRDEMLVNECRVGTTQTKDVRDWNPVHSVERTTKSPVKVGA